MNRIVLIVLMLVLGGGMSFAKDTTPKSKTTTTETAVKAKKAKHKKNVKGPQCEAMTAKGTQCTRRCDEGSKLCWQHQASRNSAKKPSAPKKS